ncbi:MAG: DUF1214 domain-containing protein [Myxococcota bacterium]
MSDEKKSQPPGGWPGMVRAAVRGAPESDPGLADGSAWAELLASLDRAGQFVLGRGAPANDLDRAGGWRHLTSLLRIGIGEIVSAVDPDRPRFSWNDGTEKWGLDCADALYATAPVRGGAVYRLRGNRGSVHYLGLQLVARMRAVADIDADTLEVEGDGRFEIQFGGEKPAGGNWIALPEDATTLIVRQFFYDWDHEVPACFEIERIDSGPRRAPRAASPGATAAQLRALGRFVHDNTAWWADVALAKRDTHVNTFPDDAGGLGAVAAASQKNQSFGIGYFRLGKDEALLIEVEPPAAKYWSLHLGNYWMESLDFGNTHSSLNGHQAVIDADGVFRAVVSLRDPGVPNWLDPDGHGEGSMIYRWNQADGSPIPEARVVAFDELRAELPAPTPVVTPEERKAAVDRRRDHVRRRYARGV